MLIEERVSTRALNARLTVSHYANGVASQLLRWFPSDYGELYLERSDHTGLVIVPVEDTRNRRKLDRRSRLDDIESCVNRAAGIANSTLGGGEKEEEVKEQSRGRYALSCDHLVRLIHCVF